MLYKGPLYAKIAGKYIPVEHDSEYFDDLENIRSESGSHIPTTEIELLQNLV